MAHIGTRKGSLGPALGIMEDFEKLASGNSGLEDSASSCIISESCMA